MKSRAALSLLLLAMPAAGCDEQCDVGDICTVIGLGEPGASEDGTSALEAALYAPADLAIHPQSGDVFVLDWNNHRVARFGEDMTLDTVTGVAGLLGDGPAGPAAEARWNHPTGLDFLSDGSLVVAAWHNSRVLRVDLAADAVEILAGTGARDFGGDGGPLAECVFDLPVGVSVDDQDQVYVGDQANQRVRLLGADGLASTVIGTGQPGFGGDGGPGTGALLSATRGQEATPAGKVTWHDGVVYIADTENGRVRAWDSATGLITTLAGIGVTEPVAECVFPDGSPGAAPDCPPEPCTGCGYGGDGGPAGEAMLQGPVDTAVGPDGTVYIADSGNHCIRAVDPDGMISTVAGICGDRGMDGDLGPATEAQLATPWGVDVDAAGNLWIADSFNHRIRKVQLVEAD